MSEEVNNKDEAQKQQGSTAAETVSQDKETKQGFGSGAHGGCLTKSDMANRVKAIQSLLMRGRSRKQICAEVGLTKGQYQSALRWLGGGKIDNHSAWVEYLTSEQARLDSIEERMDRGTVEHKDYIAMQRLCHQIRTDLVEMAMKLGKLRREPERIEALVGHAIAVGIGDEREEIGWPQKQIEGQVN